MGLLRFDPCGERQVYRIPAAGGEIKQITRNGGTTPSPSPDGKWIFYIKLPFALWRIPAEGGEESAVPVGNLYNSFSFWVANSGVYFAAAPDPVTRAIPVKLYRFADGTVRELGRLPRPLAIFLTVSPDEKWLAYTQLDSSLDDLMLVENFQ